MRPSPVEEASMRGAPGRAAAASFVAAAATVGSTEPQPVAPTTHAVRRRRANGRTEGWHDERRRRTWHSSAGGPTVPYPGGWTSHVLRRAVHRRDTTNAAPRSLRRR